MQRPRKIRRRSTPTTICQSKSARTASNERSDEGQRADQSSAHLRVVSGRPAPNELVGDSDRPASRRLIGSRDGDVPSLRPLDFHINDGEFFVVVGPSGCGKSTLLKMISGLLAPSSGRNPRRRHEGDRAARRCRHRIPELAAAAVAQYPRQRHAADRHEKTAAREISGAREVALEDGRPRGF